MLLSKTLERFSFKNNNFDQNIIPSGGEYESEDVTFCDTIK